jgi:D,D-heptose 1,7-bisphosphate phosphatase
VKRAVFLDRDGVINRYFCNPEFGTIDSPANPDEFVLAAGVPEALDSLSALGFLLIVVSNQPGIAKGRFTHALLDATTEKMKTECGGRLDGVYYCLHHPRALLPEYRQNCGCRKPKPGLLLQAAREWGVDLGTSYMIGDGVVDIKAGNAAGVTTIFLGSRKCYLCAELEQQNARPTFVARDLKAAAKIVRAATGKEPIAAEYVPCR